MDTTQLITQSLRQLNFGKQSAGIMQAALIAVDPRAAVLKHLIRDGEFLKADGFVYNLDDFSRVILVGAGKAGQPMAEAVYQVLGDKLETGIVVVKGGYKSQSELPGKVHVHEAGHPIPDAEGVAAALKIIRLLEQTDENDLVISLISGGGSALMTSPVEGISLEDLQNLTQVLLDSGANINEINTLRKHLDRIKGGQLARYAYPSKMINLILSDVVGDPLDVIASGPSVPDGSTFAEALAILEKYQIKHRIPTTVLEYLQLGADGLRQETPKFGEAIFSGVINIIVGSNRTASQAAFNQAIKDGFNTLVLSNFLQGEARQAGKFLAAILKQVALYDQPISRPACIIAGGETTVIIQGEGLGGRNQELVLSAVTDLQGLTRVAMISLATDGGDGPSDAAGAVVTGETYQRALSLGLLPESFLKRNDAYNFFEPLGDLIKTGPTQTNVNDLIFLFAY